MVAPLLKTIGVSKKFYNNQEALTIFSDIHLEVFPGEMVSIQGESGSGKTTFLNILGALEQMDEGELYWMGERIQTNDKGLEKKRAQLLGFVFQSYYLMPELNALENVLIAHRIGQCIEDAEAKERAHALLQRVGMEARASYLPNILSGGERQRVAIARALMNRPQLILADEPTGNLDEKTAQEVFDCFIQAAIEENTGIVLVTHSTLLARRTHKQLLLKEGRLRQ